MKIMTIGAHPDDIELGCGGMILRMAAEEIHMVVCTPGLCSHDPDERMYEQNEAAAKLGVCEENVLWGTFADGHLRWDKPLVGFIEQVISRVKPDVVFTHWPRDTHQDHVAVANATLAAARRSCQLLYYETLSSYEFEPTTFVDVTDVVESKIEAVAKHVSQNTRIEVAERPLEKYARDTMAFRGLQSRMYRYAEGFVPVRVSLLLD